MRYIITVAVTGLLLSFSACGDAAKDKPVAKKYKYVCVMDPQIGSDKPGICSKCGMELVERDTTEDK